MDFLQGKQLLQKNEELISADAVIKKKILILYYFTAKDCEPCRTFDVKLENVYREATTRKIELCIIVVCTDGDKESMMSNWKDNYGEWYAVPFEDDLNEILKYNYGVTHIPCLIVVRKNGSVVTRDGKSEIEDIGKNVLVTWL